MAELRLESARMDVAALLDHGEHRSVDVRQSLRIGLVSPDLPDVSWDEAIGVEAAFLDRERRIVAREVAGLIPGDSKAQDQILRRCRRPDRIGLHEPESLDRLREWHRGEERMRYRVRAQGVAHGTSRRLKPRLISTKWAWAHWR
jgi:hypothetical protein